MRTGNALLFTVSGVAAARTTEFYKALSHALPHKFKKTEELKHTNVVFLGNPFKVDGRRQFPLPLLWNDEERGWHPTTRILNCWKRLNEFGVRKLRPALDEYDVVFTERLGFDAVDYSTACCDNDSDIAAAERLHHELVKLRIIEQDIRPPVYFIPMADMSDTDALVRAVPKLEGRDPRILRDFMAHEARVLQRYFDKSTGQQTPVLLPASMTIEDMCNRAIEVVTQHLLPA